MNAIAVIATLALLSAGMDVPFVRQKPHFCGPAALASVMAFFGDAIGQDEIARAVYSPSLKGALVTDLENYARGRGYKTELRQGSLDDVRRHIAARRPVILLVDRGLWFASRPHYLVVFGRSGDSFIAHTGDHAGVAFSPAELRSLWDKAGNVLLVVFR